ncbi:MAG: PPC domain-containing protein [Candidatus Korarchaeota archaeon]
MLYRRALSVLILAALIIQPIALINEIMGYYSNAHKKPETTIKEVGDSIYIIKRLPNEIITVKIDKKLLKAEQAGSTHSLWWNESWEYRVNLTITEPNVIDRTDWPVDAYLSFNPPAQKYSVRLIEVLSSEPYFQEVPYQLWNITMYNSTHISSATITFLTSIAYGGSKQFQIYWSTLEKDPPSYPKRVSVTTASSPEGTQYTVSSSQGWSVKIPPTLGGKVSNLTLASGDTIGHTHLHFGISRNPTLTYEGYLGTGNTDSGSYMWRGIDEYQDPLTNIYAGIVFVTYKVTNLALIDQNLGEIAKVNFTYRFYPWGIIVEEKVVWQTSDDATYFVGGWVFDQNNGAGPASTFDRVGSDTDISRLPPVIEYPRLTGSIAGTFGKILGNTSGPWLRVHRVYLTAGSHTIAVTGTPDDPGLIVYDPNGAYVTSRSGVENSVSVTVSVTTAGYYFVAVYCYDEDAPLNGIMDYTLSIDGVVYTVSWVYAANNYGTIPYSAISVHDLPVTSEAVGKEYTVDLSWSTSDNLDLYICNPDGNISGLSIGTTIGERVIFTPPSAGHYTILVSRYSGTSTSVAYTVDILVKAGPEYEDVSGTATGRNLAFFHSTEPRGIGIDILSEELPGTPGSVSTIWYNEGDDSEEDYIFWARRYTGLQVSLGSSLRIRYAIILWSPAGTTDSERFADFSRLVKMVENPLQRSLGSVERYKILVAVEALDKDEAGIQNVNISFYDSSGIKRYSRLTGADGRAIFDVERVFWNITAEFASGGYTYKSFIQAYYNNSAEYGYTVHSTSESIHFSELVKFVIRAFTNETPPNILSGGYIYLNSSAEKNAKNMDMVVAGYTDAYGYFHAYIPYGSWSLRFNRTGNWDHTILYVDESLQNNITPVRIIHTLDINTGVIYYLRDWDFPQLGVTTVAGKLEVVTTPSPLVIYWKDTFTITIGLKRSDTDELINGTINWWIIAPDGTILDSGSVISNRNYVYIVYNTSTLPAGVTYTIRIEASITETPPPGIIFLDPVPVLRDLTVRERIAISEVTVDPATVIFWNESLTITVRLTDAFDGSIVGGASVKATIVGVGDFTLVEVSGGVYRLHIGNFYWSAGLYNVMIVARKDNYARVEKSFAVYVDERPTDLNAPQYIEIQWQSSYSLIAEYIDSRTNRPIPDANVTYYLTDLAGNVILQGQMIYSQGKYSVTLNIALLSEGTYMVNIQASKSNYQSRTVSIYLAIRARATQLSAETTKLSLIYGQDISIRFYYKDIESGELVTEAEASYDMLGVDVDYSSSGSLLDLGNGTYLLFIPTTNIGFIGTFSVTIFLSKVHYQPQTITVTVIINPIPTYAVVPKDTYELSYGEYADIAVWYMEYETQQPIIDADASFEIYYKGYLLKHGTLIVDVSGAFRLSIDTLELLELVQQFEAAELPFSVLVKIYLSKQYYRSQTVTVAVTVEKLTLSVNVAEAPPQSIFKVQLIDEHKISRVTLSVLHNGVPVEDANIAIIVTSEQAGISRIYTANALGYGVFSVTIDWADFPPGYVWIITVHIESVKVYGRWIPYDKIIYTKPTIKVFMDYVSGSTKVGPIYIANMFLYPMLVILMAAFSYGSYRIISWLMLPWQVREVIKILRMIEKGIFEYRAPDRKEFITRMISEELKTK